jgi:hypothetical protein
MTKISDDQRFNFKQKVPMAGSAGTLVITVTGGPLARLCAGVFDKDGKPLQGVGFGNFPPPLTTLHGGTTSWSFEAPANASYVQWGVQAQRSAGRLGDYTVTANLKAGAAELTAHYDAQIPDGMEADDVVVYDGVYLS